MLSRSYLELLESDLLSLTDAEMKRIRIVGPPISAIDPERLINVYMPYDGRLDSLGPPYQCTKGDFSQRAGRHFAEVIIKKKDMFIVDGIEKDSLIQKITDTAWTIFECRKKLRQARTGVKCVN